MFGTYEKNLDSKNRIVIPSKFREELGDVIFITLSFEKALEIRSKKSFKEFSDKITSNNSLDSNMRQLSRYIFANTMEVNIDKSGRALVLENLLKKANIEKEITIVGLGDKAEIWAKDKFEAITSTYEDDISTLTEELFKKGAVL